MLMKAQAVTRSIDTHLPQDGTPRWLGIRKRRQGGRAAVLADLAGRAGPMDAYCAPRLQTWHVFWHGGAPRAVYCRCQPDTRLKHGLPGEAGIITAAATYDQVRAEESTSGPRSVTMHRVPPV